MNIWRPFVSVDRQVSQLSYLFEFMLNYSQNRLYHHFALHLTHACLQQELSVANEHLNVQLELSRWKAFRYLHQTIEHSNNHLWLLILPESIFQFCRPFAYVHPTHESIWYSNLLSFLVVPSPFAPISPYQVVSSALIAQFLFVFVARLWNYHCRLRHSFLLKSFRVLI